MWIPAVFGASSWQGTSQPWCRMRDVKLPVRGLCGDFIESFSKGYYALFKES